MGKLYFLIFLPVFILVFAFGNIVEAVSDYQIVPNLTDSVTPPTVYIRPSTELQERCQDCTYTAYRLVRQLNCGATVAIQDPGELPTCMLVPRVTKQGAIELTWDTKQTNVAFIDKGVGHVSTPSGSRIVTPTTNTEYNMTVINEGGLVNNCSARVEVLPTNLDSATPLTVPELNTVISGQQDTEDSGRLETFLKSWWWLLLIAALIAVYAYNKIKDALDI